MSDCILFEGVVDKWGYGRCYGGKDRPSMFAHRKAWEDKHGPIPYGYFVCHRCDTPACVNPEHLFLGTAKDNHDDMVRKGRRALFSGERNGRARINESTANMVRSLKGTLSGLEIARRVGLKKSQVYNILSGKSWRSP